MMRWDDVDANEDDATEEEELARPNSPSFNARTRFDDDARRIISYLFSLSSQMCVRAWCIHASWGNGMKVTSPSRCEIRLKLGLKVYQKRSKKKYFFVLREAKTKKSSSEERATSPLLLGVRGQFLFNFCSRSSSLFFCFFEMIVSAFFSPLEGFFALSRFFAFLVRGSFLDVIGFFSSRMR